MSEELKARERLSSNQAEAHEHSHSPAGDLPPRGLERQPCWSCLEKTLAVGGLGSWRLSRQADGEIFIEVSDAFLTITGLRRDDVPRALKACLDKFLTPADAAAALAEVEQLFAGRAASFSLEHPLMTSPGRPVWVRTFADVTGLEESGETASLFGFSQDITSQHQYAEALAAGKARMDDILDAAKVGVWDWDVPANLIDFSEGYLSILGLQRSPMRGTIESWYSRVHPDDLEAAQQAIDAALSGRTEAYSLTARQRRSDGNYVWLYESGRVLTRDDQGRAVRLVGLHLDFTDRKKIEQQQDQAMLNIAEQAVEMETRMSEKTRLLYEVRRQVEGIIDNYGPEGQNDEPEWTLDARDHDGSFAYYLNRAFSLITSHLDWYKAILDSLPFPVGVYDNDGRWTYLNRLEAELHGGGAVRQYLGQPFDQDAVDYEDTDIVHSGDAVRFTRYLRDSGRLFNGQNSILRDAGGVEIGRIETLRDVTAVREADERTQIMLDALPLACNFWDEQFRNIDCNQAAAKLFDLPDKQAYLDNFFKLSPEFQPNGRPSAELAVENITKAFRDGYCRFEWLHQKLDGTPVPAEITLIRVARRNSHIVAGYTRDLRELKATQAERDIERKLLRKIMDSTPICFAITVSGVIKFITPFGFNFTGRTVGEDMVEIYEDPEVWRGLKTELDERGVINWRPVEIRRADGRIRSMLLNAFKTDYYGEGGVMSWLMDVTELKERAQELKEARDAAEESTRAKSEFLANMSHEIRTPMNAILGLIHLVMQTELTEVQLDYLQKTESSAKTLLRIINDILDFSKIEAGKLEMEKEEFHLADVMQQVVDLVSTKAHEKGLEFLVLVPPDTQAGLVGDQVRLAQVLSNLAGNAVKFTDCGQVTVKVETVSETDDEVTLRFLVEDTGIGLTPEQTSHLFSAFTQAEVSTTRRYGGTGLGLVISKRLVEMMGGEIWCRSNAGCGSVFGFTAVFGKHAGGQRYVSNRKDFRGLAALAVDDNVVALEILSDFLRTLGFNVVTAASGQEAISVLTEWNGRGEHFDLVFIDWKMPDMDGIETSNRIHELISPTKLPVIIMATAYNRDDVLDQARQSGIRNVMTKPLSPSTMLNVLVDIFGRGLPEKESKLKKAHEMAVVKEFEGSRVLLAEDNEVNQLVASRILKNAGLVVEIANNGREAVEMVGANNYDLVLMDIQMPEMDGITATKEIRALPEFQSLPIVAMTAHAMSGDRELSLKAGMNDHINKPINLQELFSTLAKWLRKRPRLQ